MITTLLADDDDRVRTDLAALLDLEPDIVVVDAVGDGRAAVQSAGRLRPDVVVMDVRMPVLDGIAATEQLRSLPGPGQVLVLTTFDLDEYVLGAVRAGAAGFLLKDAAPDQLADAVRTVAAGHALVDPRATTRLIRALIRPEPADHRLTEREVDMVRRLARGLSNAEIAAETHLSRLTVKAHLSSILTKLGLTSRIQVVVWAYEHGLVRPGQAAGTGP